MSSYAQVNILWATRYTSSGNNIDKAEDMVTDASRNTYVTGIGRGASGGFDYITIKYNSAGVQQWKAEYNGTGNGLDEAHAIAVDASGNVYVTGWSNGGATPGFDYVTVKYNSAGVQQWATSYNNAAVNGTDEAWDIGVDNAGNVYVTGSSDGATADGSAATSIKYNSAGVQQYVIRYDDTGGDDIDAGFAIYVEPVSGTFYITGYTFRGTGTFDFLTVKYNTAGTQQWRQRYNGPGGFDDEARAITVDAAGNVYVTGYSQTAVSTNYDYSTVKYNSAGTQQWARNYNGTGNDYDRANAIKLDAVGNVYVTGRSVGAGTDAEDMLTIKYTNGGTEKWTARYNGTTNGYDEGNALAIDGAGNIYVAGYSYAAASNNDYIVIKYDSTGTGANGNQLWVAKYNGTGNNTDQAVGVAVDATGNVYVSGQSRGSGSNDDYATVKFCQLTANAGNDTAICKGASASLKASATGAVSYAWTPSAGLSSTTVFNPVATPTVTTTYVVAITNGSGCVDRDTVVVSVVALPTPTITASGPTTFCIGDSVRLTASAETAYQWSTSSTLQSIKVTTSGTYTVTVTNSTGCKGTAFRVVNVNSLPVINAGADASICIGSSRNLLATGGSSYVWHYGNTLSDSTIANPVATPLATTTYTVIGTSAAGCKKSDAVKITVLPLPVVDAGLNNNVCSGSSVSIQATGASTYVWRPGNSLTDSTIFNPVASPTNTTTYTVVGTAANGCTKSDAVKITVLALPAINAGSDDSICVGSSINLQASGGVFYMWHLGNTLDDSTIFDPIATPITTTTYTVIGTGASGCTKMDAVKISVFSVPVISAGADDSVCMGSSIQLQASGGLTYTWSPAATLSNASIFNPLASPTAGTTYTVTGNGAGCSRSDAVYIKVLTNPSVPTIYRGTDTLYCAQSAVSYKWYRNGVEIPGAADQWYKFIQNGTYNVEVYNTSGCSSSSATINILDISVGEVDGADLLMVYPNPATDNLTFELTMLKESDVQINLTSITGQLVFTDNLNQFTGMYKKQISLQGNAKGVYHLQIITNDRVINTKVVKQ